MSVDLAVASQGLASVWEENIQIASGQDAVLYNLVKAVITRESGWTPNAVRPEPLIGDASYGLMQVLLRTARLYDGGITPDQLLDPPTNITIGTTHLSGLLGRYFSISDAVAAYNAGSVRRNAAGLYINSRGDTKVQSYVNDVMTYYVWFTNQMAATPVDQPVESGWLTDFSFPNLSVIDPIFLIAGGVLLLLLLTPRRAA